ncbi:putative ABC transport system ATP-binding protein [Clostridium sp. DSM 8431]|uniref:ABC transporter ATP-binding protein n=1 Tax=Clostridium sp. DSM 8431 TaxID=1761781 RepID=UPI0008E13BE8|nr:ABC transporter ATP-binding protein [Clostridium sp. DSM 8431]SFU61058.1 putative ABC transport system ATP-binding protein [Clostridium sp. DSM 8431]
MIKVENLSKLYMNGEVETNIINNASFTIEDGEFSMILGPSGAGKSTLLYLLGLLEESNGGSIYINDVEVNKLSANKQSDFRLNHIGFIFQFYNLLQGFNIIDNVLTPVMLSGKSVKKYKTLAVEYLKQVGLYEKRFKYPNELSGGEQQRVAIARALIMEPDILLADEPTGNLDSKTSLEVMELLKKINKEKKCTIVMVTHNNELVSYADKVITVKDGQVKI